LPRRAKEITPYLRGALRHHAIYAACHCHAIVADAIYIYFIFSIYLLHYYFHYIVIFITLRAFDIAAIIDAAAAYAYICHLRHFALITLDEPRDITLILYLTFLVYAILPLDIYMSFIFLCLPSIRFAACLELISAYDTILMLIYLYAYYAFIDAFAAAFDAICFTPLLLYFN